MHRTSTWGTWLAQRRALLDLTQLDLANMVGCSESLIYKLERNMRRPSKQVASLLAQYLQLHTDYHAVFIQAARGLCTATQLPPPVYAHMFGGETHPLPFSVPPKALNRLIGRTEDLYTLCRMLAIPATRCVTLTGPGGVGKTHLAQELATQLEPWFHDGILWVDLTRLHSAALLPVLLTQLMHLPQTHPDDGWSQIKQIIQQRRCLFMLDNAEHLQPELAQHIEQLLALSTQLTILVTSRIALSIAQERVVPLHPFDLSQLTATLSPAHIQAHPAVALFLERMQQQGRPTEPTPQMLPAIISLCHMLDGLPLALELAAARTRVLPPPVLLDQLTDQLLPLLQHHGPNRPERQQTLYHTIDWSYQLLPQAVQAVFIRLGFFTTSVDLPTVLAVCCEPAQSVQLQTHLAMLVDVHLVLCTTQADGTTTYSMFETIRSFAVNKLQEQALYAQVVYAYSRYLIDTTDTIFRAIREHDVNWTAHIDQHHSPVQYTLAYLVEHDKPTAIQIINSLSFFWEVMGYWQHSIHWYTLITKSMESSSASREYIRLQHHYCRALNYLDKRSQALPVLEQTLAFAQQQQFEDLYSGIFHSLGDTYLMLGRLVDAKRSFEAMHSIVMQQNDQKNTALSFMNLANVARALGQPETAWPLYNQGLTAARRQQEQLYICASLVQFATALIDLGNAAEAEPMLVEAQELAEHIRYRGAQEHLQLIGGRAAVIQGQLEIARQKLQLALTMTQESGNRSDLCMTLETFACVAARTHQLQQAAQLLGAASALRQQWNTPQIYTNVILDHLTHCLEQHTTPALRMRWQAQGATFTLEEMVNLAFRI